MGYLVAIKPRDWFVLVALTSATRDLHVMGNIGNREKRPGTAQVGAAHEVIIKGVRVFLEKNKVSPRLEHEAFVPTISVSTDCGIAAC